MKQAIKVCLFVLLILLLSFAAYAEDIVKDFTFKTIDGKTLDYQVLNGMPMVIIVGSHW